MKYSSVLLISIDSLSKKYSKYFYPYFNEIYLNYQSTNTWTLPGHFSMLTGQVLPELYFQPKIKDLFKYKSYISFIPTIASFFKKMNFKTKAITGGGFMSKYFGWGHDWDEWIEATNSEEEWQGEKINIEKNSFVFLHTYYVHNWFEDVPKLNSLFTINRKKMDTLKIMPKNDIIKAKVNYINRIKILSERLSWLKKLDKGVLVILTSDHGELFFEDNENFHHGRFALKSYEIFKVPLLIKTNKNKKIVREIIYDFHLPLLISKKIAEKKKEYKLGIDNLKFYTEEKSLRNQLHQTINVINNLNSQLTKAHLRIQNLETQLNIIKSAKAFKLWQAYCRIRDKILRKK